MSVEAHNQYLERILRHGGPDEGEKGLAAGLRVMGVKVPRYRLREAMEYLGRDPRAAPQPIMRRIYRVPWINSLWHMDGHHKLISWKIVIHGCIDGYSRMITFMNVADNNRAETVLVAFQQAVAEYGWPSRVRSDRGKENWDVKRIMEEVRGEYHSH